MNSITHQIANLLNEMLALDPRATKAFLFNRTPCSHALTTHSTIQTDEQSVGLLGILNGLAGTEDGEVVPVFDDTTGQLEGFDARVAP